MACLNDKYYLRTVTTLWQNAEFHLVYVIKLISNVVPATLWTIITFRIFVKKHTSVNFNSERKCCGVDQTFLKDVTNVPTRSQIILSKLGKICQEFTVENVHVVNHGVRNTCFIKWDRLTWTWKHSEAGGPGKFWWIWAPLNGWKCIRNFENLMFSLSKSMTVP